MKRVSVLIATVLLVGQLTQAFAGSSYGSRQAILVVNARSYDTFTTTFRGRDMAQVRVKGYGETVLEVYVLDQDGDVVTSNNDYHGECTVTWYPPATGDYTVVVVNRSYSAQDYCVSHN